MADQQPPPWFTAQGKTDPPDFEHRKQQLLQELPKLLLRQKDRGRAQSFYPYLLVRSVLGDRGDRPINVPFWESPDIWTAPGDPEASPAVPATHGGVLTAGQPNTVYAHVWNLGFAPLAGIVVEFYWFNPSLGIDGTDGHLIGTARCQLAARGMPGSHALVKCPKAWVPVIENGGHECLVVRVHGMGDPLGGNEWHPWQNRHVAQRNVSVVPTGQNLNGLISRLGQIGKIARLQLVQLAPTEGEFAARIVAPSAKIAATTPTHVLSELNAEGQVMLTQRPELAPAALAPFHAMTAGAVPAPPVLKRPGEAMVANTPAMVAAQHGPEPAPAAGIASLFASVPQLHMGAQTARPPAPGEVNVLRLANYDTGGQLVGGYTLVVPGQ
jgi:hypothetical protein